MRPTQQCIRYWAVQKITVVVIVVVLEIRVRWEFFMTRGDWGGIEYSSRWIENSILNISDVWWAKPVWDSADQPDVVLSTIRCFQHYFTTYFITYNILFFITYDLIISTIRPMWALSILQVIIIHHDDQSDDDEHVVCVMCNKFHFSFKFYPFLLNIYHIFPFIFQQSHHCPLGWLHVGWQRDALEPLDRHLHLRLWRDSSKF